MVILMTSLSSSKTEFACVFYDVFDVGGFTGLIQGRVLTIFFWAFSHLLLIGISIKIVLALVASFPTNLVSSNSESVCRSCVSFGVLKRLQRYYRGQERKYFFTTALGSGTTAWSSTTAATSVATSARDQKLVTSPAVVGTDVIF